MASQVKDGCKVDANEASDCCPVHGGDSRKEYDFGMQDATVIVYEGCKCAVCLNRADGFGDNASYHTSYNGAAGVARLIVAGEDAFAHKYGM